MNCRHPWHQNVSDLHDLHAAVCCSMLQYAAASSNNKACDFRTPLALADGLKLELAAACHALRIPASSDVKLQGVFLTHHDKGW